jgi:hypothetical protein
MLRSGAGFPGSAENLIDRAKSRITNLIARDRRGRLEVMDEGRDFVIVRYSPTVSVEERCYLITPVSRGIFGAYLEIRNGGTCVWHGLAPEVSGRPDSVDRRYVRTVTNVL